jgi:hypothetical protein
MEKAQLPEPTLVFSTSRYNTNPPYGEGSVAGAYFSFLYQL